MLHFHFTIDFNHRKSYSIEFCCTVPAWMEYYFNPNKIDISPACIIVSMETLTPTTRPPLGWQPYVVLHRLPHLRFYWFLLQIDEHLYIHENPFFFVFQHSMWVVPDLNFLRGWDMLKTFFFFFCRIYQYLNLITINCKCVTHTTLNPGTTLFICHKLSFVYLINLMNDKSVN